MQTMRAKFICHRVIKSESMSGEGQEEIYAVAVTSGSEENKVFSKYTPAGSLNLTITNPVVFGLLAEEQEFFLDIVPL